MSEIVRQAQVMKTVVSMLTTEFNCPVYSDEVREHFRKPCFFISGNSTMTPQTLNWVDKELRITLDYYAKDNEKNEITYMDVIDRVQSLFAVDIDAGERNRKIDEVEDDRVGEEDDVLSITLTILYKERVNKAASTAETADTVSMSINHNAGRADKETYGAVITKETI